jgi:hypothetical protein
MEDLAALRRLKLEQCVGLATYQSDASQVHYSPVVPRYSLLRGQVHYSPVVARYSLPEARYSLSKAWCSPAGTGQAKPSIRQFLFIVGQAHPCRRPDTTHQPVVGQLQPYIGQFSLS